MWKSVCGFDGYYEVSDDGKVRGVERYVSNGEKVLHIPSRTLNPTPTRGRNNKDGYMVVNLRKNGLSHVMPVHALVAQAFVPNPEAKQTINHINGDKHDNRAENLEWATYAENNHHAYKTGLHQPWGKTVLQYDLNGNLLARFKSGAEASRQTGVGAAMISHCVHHRTKTAGGFVWIQESEGATTIPLGSSAEIDAARSA